MKQALIALGLVGALAVAGCSSDTEKTDASKDTKAAKTTTSTTTKPAFVANTKNTPGTLKDFVGAKIDVSDTKCVSGDKGWTATGKAKNPTNAKVQYRIFVSFLEGETTVGIAQTDVSAAAGATANWTATVGAAGKDLRCILRVERAAA